MAMQRNTQSRTTTYKNEHSERNNLEGQPSPGLKVPLPIPHTNALASADCRTALPAERTGPRSVPESIVGVARPGVWEERPGGGGFCCPAEGQDWSRAEVWVACLG